MIAPKIKTLRGEGEVMHRFAVQRATTAVMRRFLTCAGEVKRRFLTVAREVMRQFLTASRRGGDASVPYCHGEGDAWACVAMRRFLTAHRMRSGALVPYCGLTGEVMCWFLTAMRCRYPENGAQGRCVSDASMKLLRCVTDRRASCRERV